MIRDERAGGGTADGRNLWLNQDWQAKPWAGLASAAARIPLTLEWLDHGFVRFLLNATVDRYGHPAGELKLQLKPDGGRSSTSRLPSRFIDRGRGRDEDEASWQEVLMPLALWRESQARRPRHRARASRRCTRRRSPSVSTRSVSSASTALPDWYE